MQAQKKPVEKIGSPFINKRRASFYDVPQISFSDLPVDPQQYENYRQSKDKFSCSETSGSELSYEDVNKDDLNEQWQDADTYDFVQEYNSPVTVPIKHRSICQPVTLRKSSLSDRLSVVTDNYIKEGEQKDKNSTDSGVNCTLHVEAFFKNLTNDHDISEVKRLSDEFHSIYNLVDDEASNPLLNNFHSTNTNQLKPYHHFVMAPNMKLLFSNPLPALERLSEMFLARSVPFETIEAKQSEITENSSPAFKWKWRTIIFGTMTTVAAVLATIIILI